MKKIKFDNNFVRVIDFDDILKKIESQKNKEIIQNSVTDEEISILKSKPESKLTSSERKKIELRKNIEEKYKNKLAFYDSYKEVVVIPYTNDYNKDIEFLRPVFKEVGDKVEQSFIPELDIQKIKRNIDENKKILSDTDYIITKSYEAKLSMSDAPYTSDYLDEIISKRQMARDRINELQSFLPNE